MTRPGSLVRNVLSNWFVLASGIASALFITPIVVRALDKELYGVWSFLNGLLSYSELLYLGLGSAVVRYVAEYRAKDDQAGINRIASVVVLIYCLLGLLCLGVLIGVSPLVPRAFAVPLSAPAVQAAKMTCALLGVQMLFIFAGSAFAGVVAGHDRYDLVNAGYVAGIALRSIAIPILVRPDHHPLVSLAVITSVVAALQAAGFAGIAFRSIPHLSIRLARPNPKELRLLYGFGLQSFFILFAVKLISYTDTTVIGFRLGAASVALYSLPLQLVEYARASVAGFAGVFLPRLTALATRGDFANIREAYLNSTRIACFLAGWLAAILISLGPSFLSRWVGHEFGAPVHWVVVYLAIATFAQVVSTQVPTAFYQALHLIRFPAAILMIEALVNVALSIWLAPRLGITGVAIATAVPALLLSLTVLPPYLCRRLQVPLRLLVIKSVLPGALVLLASLGAEWLIGLLLRGQSYPIIIGRLLLSVPVALALFRATFPDEQRQAVWQIVRLPRTTRLNPR